MFPWVLRHLPGPHQELFRHHEAVRGFIHQEILRHRLVVPDAPRDFISCYLAQITKVGLELWAGRWLGGRGCLLGYPSLLSLVWMHHL